MKCAVLFLKEPILHHFDWLNCFPFFPVLYCIFLVLCVYLHVHQQQTERLPNSRCGEICQMLELESLGGGGSVDESVISLSERSVPALPIGKSKCPWARLWATNWPWVAELTGNKQEGMLLEEMMSTLHWILCRQSMNVCESGGTQNCVRAFWVIRKPEKCQLSAVHLSFSIFTSFYSKLSAGCGFLQHWSLEEPQLWLKLVQSVKCWNKVNLMVCKWFKYEI